MELAVRRLQAVMQMQYGEEYRKKWQGFSPKEMALLWTRQFSLDGIHEDVVTRMCDRLTWEHPPTLPQLMVALKELQEEMHREHRGQQAEAALPAPDDRAPKDSPARLEFLAELARWNRRHVA